MAKKFLALPLVLLSIVFLTENLGRASDGSESSIMGPSVHAALGIRSKKAPDLDTYYSTVGGIKVSPFSIRFGQSLYLALICPGLHYAGYGIFAPSLTPLIFYSNYGLGFAVDLFPVRGDRMGGPLGLSINIDIPRVVGLAMGYVQ